MKPITKEQILQVEYYDQLTEDDRREYRDNTLELTPEVLAEMDRIDKGLKALCLS